MLTPKRVTAHVSKSATNTPFRRADSDPVKHPLTFSPEAKTVSSPLIPPSSIPESPGQSVGVCCS